LKDVITKKLAAIPILAVAITFTGCDLFQDTLEPQPDDFDLIITVTGEGEVSVSPDAAIYAKGTVIELTAFPSAGWSFRSWSGDASGPENPLTVTMDAPRTITAVFIEDAFTLTVTTTGNGTVSKSPDQAAYLPGETVELTATPALGWDFSHWSGDISGSTNPLWVIIDANKMITAVFTKFDLLGVSLSHLVTYTPGNTGSNGLAGKEVRSVYIDGEDVLYAGTWGGVSVYDGTNWTAYTTADGLASNDVYSVYADSEGVLYVGTWGGVSVYDGATWTTYTTADGLAVETVN
jgi:hypothetical protein